MKGIRTVLFDLDGTLADTAPDLARALNALLAERGRDPLPFAAIRPVVSHGARGLVTLGFGIAADDPAIEPLRLRLIDLYRQHLCVGTRLFPGIPELLAALHARGCTWGIVTNKPAHLTDPLVACLEPAVTPVCVVSGDTTARPKPHPEPMWHASRLAGRRPAECLYVGDAERDVLAGREAGMKTLVALFGYIGADDRPRDWGADGLVESPAEVLAWLDARRATAPSTAEATCPAALP